MNRQSIIVIIVIMTLALIGTSVIQFLWIKRSVDLQEKSFQTKVTEALNNVHEEIIDYQESTKSILQLPHYNSKGSLSTGFESFQSKYAAQKINDLTYKSRLNKYLDNIPPEKLGTWLSNEMENQGIYIPYDYGIYSNETKSFSIINGKFSFQSNEKPQSSSAGIEQLDGKNLYESEYKVNLFPNETESPGQLKVYFPNKVAYLWKTSWVSMVSSLIFTGLILFCFVYTINTILFQNKVSEMKTDFINNMTHEFKTPIATISLATDSINNPKIIGNADKVTRFVNIIKQENRRMLGQVEKVLQMAQLEKKDFQLKVTEFDMHDMIKTAAENSRLKVNKRDGTIKLNLEATKTRIMADNNHISNVIHNLLDNAEKYSKEIPKIEVSTFNSDKGIHIKIADKGIGMSKEALKNIFEKFYRVHTGNLHDVKGFGLGLSYVKAIVNAHKGDVKVESELGEGSSFTIFLPFYASNSD